jgi:hypothetical protein
MDLETIFLNKDGFKFASVRKNHYKLTFNLENKNIILSKIIDFNLIKLMYDLNTDVYERLHIEKINDNEIMLTLLMKHFFEDIGMPQRFLYIHMSRTVEEEKITFKAQSIKQRQPDMPEDAQLMSIQDFTCVCDIITPHSINFSVNIIFDQQIPLPAFVEKTVGMILHKIFKRVKQFIDNACI